MIELKPVAQTESKGDRRETLLRLTAKGKALHRKLVPVVLDQERRIMACLNETEFKAFSNAMDKFERSLDLAHHPDDDYE